MDQRLQQYYLEAQIKSASPGQLLVMLYDALVQNAETAEAALAVPENLIDLSPAARPISRCIDIITELSSSLRSEYEPELCAQLSSLYRFFTEELSAALDQRNAGKITAIMPLLRELRQTWTQAQKTAARAQLAAA